MKRAALGVLTVATLALATGLTGTARAVDRPLVAVVGDSYTAGWTGPGIGSQPDAWWNYTLNDLGWAQGNIVANPGAGYVKTGMFGTLYQSLHDHPIPADTAFVLVQAGLNDSTVNPDLVPAGVAAVANEIHAQAPNAVPIYIGMFVPALNGMTPNQLAVARALGDYRGIGASRYMIASMCGYEVAVDQVHPTALGHHQIGDFVAWHIAHNLGGNGDPLHPDPTGTFYTT